MKICAFTSVCESDARWVRQYLDEAVRLDIPFVMHFDRCSKDLCDQVTIHPWCVGYTNQMVPEIEFTEQHKQQALDLVSKLNYDWALAWDIDETYEREAKRKLQNAVEDTSCGPDWYDTRWLNLWNDKHHIRVDLKFAQGHRVKLYNLHRHRNAGGPTKHGRWVFDHPVTNGPKLWFPELSTLCPAGFSSTEGAKLDLVCLHHGMMTKELRREHKERWDRIYSTALKGDPNPYGFWKQAIETENSAVVVRHGY